MKKLQVFLTEEDYTLVATRAKTLNVSASAYARALILQESLSILRTACIKADEADDRKLKVKAIQAAYDSLFPAIGRYEFARVIDRRAKEWLRVLDESATDVYDVLMGEIFNHRDDEGNVVDCNNHILDNPAVYASRLLPRVLAGIQIEEHSAQGYQRREPKHKTASNGYEEPYDVAKDEDYINYAMELNEFMVEHNKKVKLDHD